MEVCRVCPRACAVDRSVTVGFCGETDTVRVAKAMLHRYEEPPISGPHGGAAGAVFFTGCNLRCVYCQNRAVSQEASGKSYALYTPETLADLYLRLEDAGANTIDLVTPTHFSEAVVRSLAIARKKLKIPVVVNTSSYDTVDTLKRYEGLADAYLPDFKYASSDLADRFSAAPDYPTVATNALREMFRQVGDFSVDENGIIRSGLIVRHLILPGHRDDSEEVLRLLAKTVPTEKIRLSLMRQYTPVFALDTPYPELHRRVTTYEYRKVLAVAEELGFSGFYQLADSAAEKYTPDFAEGGGKEICDE